MMRAVASDRVLFQKAYIFAAFANPTGAKIVAGRKIELFHIAYHVSGTQTPPWRTNNATRHWRECMLSVDMAKKSVNKSSISAEPYIQSLDVILFKQYWTKIADTDRVNSHQLPKETDSSQLTTANCRRARWSVDREACWYTHRRRNLSVQL